jgi:hypothetical protein
MVCSIYFTNRTTYVPGTVRAILPLPVVWGHMVLLQSCVDCLQQCFAYTDKDTGMAHENRSVRNS